MARLKRAESQAQTRERLLAAAHELFRREGYVTTSVERIAELAGYSKGAFYSNFEGKEAIFLAVLAKLGAESLHELLAALAAATRLDTVIECLCRWADERSRSGIWSLTILEHARIAPGSASLRRQEAIIRGHWRELGTALQARVPELADDPETLGALLHEIAYAPALTFVARPTAGSLMRLAMTRMLRGAPLQSASASAAGRPRRAVRA